MMYSFKKGRLLFIFCCLLLLVGSVACANQTSSAAGGVSTPTPVRGQKTPGGGKSVAAKATGTTANTSCPASGEGRAATMPAITLGKRQEIVSYRNADGSAKLREFDVQDKTASVIASIHGETIDEAQLAGNGQWVLMVAQKNGVQALQLVRVDGQDLQTLYCASAGQKVEAQWSPNQQQILFSQNSAHEAKLLLLNVMSGKVQVEFSNAAYGQLEPLTWLDNRHVYVGLVSSGLLYQPDNLIALDTSKGANQQASDLKTIVGSGDSPWYFDCSVDGKTAYFVSSKEPPRADALQSVIYASSALSDGFTNAIFTNHSLYITGIRVVSATTLMVLAEDPEHTHSSTNGLYTIGTDGRGLKQIVSFSQATKWPFNVSSQYTWSSFSRNGAYYVDGLAYGSFSGGSLTAYGSAQASDTLVGWTTE
jgi:hypothetical protein